VAQVTLAVAQVTLAVAQVTLAVAQWLWQWQCGSVAGSVAVWLANGTVAVSAGSSSCCGSGALAVSVAQWQCVAGSEHLLDATARVAYGQWLR
jgi:hypothetical protein